MMGEWIIVTPKRADRPFQDRERLCPFCPGQPETEGEWDVLSLDNKYAAVQPEEHPMDLEEPLIVGAPGHGYCKVIIHSRDHEMQFERMHPNQATLVFQEYARVFQELDEKQGIKYVMQFENRGKAIGVSINHPHSQVYALPFVPPRIERELHQFQDYFKRFDTCLVCETIENESKSKERIIKESQNFITILPYAARLPYEVHIYPKCHVQSLPQLGEKLEEMGEMVIDITKRYAAVFDEMAYVMALHTRPSKGNHDYWHFHVEFYPPWRDSSRRKYLAGIETGAGTFTNDSTPEEKAKELREALD